MVFAFFFIGYSSKESVHSFVKKFIPDIVDALSEGDLTCMLHHFEADLFEADVQKIKCDLQSHGKNKAISQMIDGILHHDEKTIKKFIKYLLDNKKSIPMAIKLEEYDLQDLLPHGEQSREPGKLISFWSLMLDA